MTDSAEEIRTDFKDSNKDGKMKTNGMKGELRDGIFSGLPIALGYLSVSFGFGVSAVNRGLSPLAAVLISVTNLTSAGQVAGIDIIVTAGTLIEMALVQLIINARYFMMSLSLSQKTDGSFPLGARLLLSYVLTDEVFAVSASRRGMLTPAFTSGLILLPAVGWTMGTLLGAVAGNILPEAVKLALGIAIYGMFVAIVVPPAKGDRGILLASLTAIAVSCAIAYLPFLKFITSGFSIIICAVVASAVAAVFFPVKDISDIEDDGERKESAEK